MASGKAGRGSDQFPLRLPEGLRDRIKLHADANGRSMNSEIIELIETGLFEEDLARMNAGREPLREMTERDRELVELGKMSTKRLDGRREENAQVEPYDLPFFEDGIAKEKLSAELFDKLFGDMKDRLDRIEQKVDNLTKHED